MGFVNSKNKIPKFWLYLLVTFLDIFCIYSFLTLRLNSLTKYGLLLIVTLSIFLLFIKYENDKVTCVQSSNLNQRAQQQSFSYRKEYDIHSKANYLGFAHNCQNQENIQNQRINGRVPKLQHLGKKLSELKPKYLFSQRDIQISNNLNLKTEDNQDFRDIKGKYLTSNVEDRRLKENNAKKINLDDQKRLNNGGKYLNRIMNRNQPKANSLELSCL